MSTVLTITCSIPEDSIYGTAEVMVTRFSNGKPVEEIQLYRDVLTATPLAGDMDAYAWTIATVTTAQNNIVRNMLNLMGKGLVLLLDYVPKP